MAARRPRICPATLLAAAALPAAIRKLLTHAVLNLKPPRWLGRWGSWGVGRFAFQGSKYYTGTTREPYKGRPNLQWVKSHFDFKGRPMRDAIVDEILDTQAQHPPALDGLPEMLLKVGQEYRPLPLRINPVGEWPEPPGPGAGPGQPALKR